MIFKEFRGSFWTNLQEPYDVLFDASDQTQVFWYLLLSQKSHRVVRIIHLIFLFFVETGVKIILYIVFTVQRFMIHISLKFCCVFCKTVPDIASILVWDTRWDIIILDIHDPGEEHECLLELLVNNKPPLVLWNTAKNESFINATIHDMLDSLSVATQAAVSVQVHHSTDIVNIWPSLLAFCVVVLGQLVNVENHLILVCRLLSHLKRVLDFVQDRVSFDKLTHAHHWLWPAEVDERSKDVTHFGHSKLDGNVFILSKNCLNYLHLVWVNTFALLVTAEHANNFQKKDLFLKVLVLSIHKFDWL